MKNLIEFMIKSIVQTPDEVEIEEIPGQGFTTLKISANKGDYGQIIGKNGKIIKALLTLVQAGSFKENKRYFVNIESGPTSS